MADLAEIVVKKGEFGMCWHKRGMQFRAKVSEIWYNYANMPVFFYKFK
jgi:hypothetical protein